MNVLKKLAIGILLISPLYFASPKTLAAQAPTGITISPAFQQISVAASEATKSLSIKITNNQSSSQNLTLSTADFSTLGDTGGLFFVGSNPTSLQKKYGLAKWLQLPFSKAVVQPHQTLTINAKIIDLPDLDPGGHYGTINVAVEGADSKSANNVNFHPIASSLLFVTKLGGDTHKLSLTSVNLHRDFQALPATVDLKFQNIGNTHLVPRGLIRISDPRGRIVSQGTINENSDFILPQISRIYTIQMHSLLQPYYPGKYKVEVDYRFDGLDQPKAYQTSFTLLLIKPLIIVMVLALIVITFAIFLFRHKLRKRHI